MVAKINASKLIESSTRNLEKMFKGIEKSSSDTKINMEKLMKDMGDYDVLVGIPQEKASRKDGEISNAELAFMHTHGVRSPKMIKEMEKDIKKGSSYSEAYKLYLLSHGSPAYRVPPRPIIEPAIEANIEVLAKGLKKAMEHFLEGDKENGESELNRVGLRAQGYVRGWFTDPRNNWPPNAPSTVQRKGSDRPLIDTGELRKSITYIVKTKQDVQTENKTNAKEE